MIFLDLITALTYEERCQQLDIPKEICFQYNLLDKKIDQLHENDDKPDITIIRAENESPKDGNKLINIKDLINIIKEVKKDMTTCNKPRKQHKYIKKYDSSSDETYHKNKHHFPEIITRTVTVKNIEAINTENNKSTAIISIPTETISPISSSSFILSTDKNHNNMETVITLTKMNYSTITVEKPITLYREMTITKTKDKPIVNYKVTTVTETITITNKMSKSDNDNDFVSQSSSVPKTVTINPTIKDDDTEVNNTSCSIPNIFKNKTIKLRCTKSTNNIIKPPVERIKITRKELNQLLQKRKRHVKTKTILNTIYTKKITDDSEPVVTSTVYI